jgi:hypothetical protein
MESGPLLFFCSKCLDWNASSEDTKFSVASRRTFLSVEDRCQNNGKTFVELILYELKL